jgi:hypothetical protein
MITPDESSKINWMNAFLSGRKSRQKWATRIAVDPTRAIRHFSKGIVTRSREKLPTKFRLFEILQLV